MSTGHRTEMRTATISYKELRKASHGRFGFAKAQEIQTAARRSVGVTFLADAIRVEMRCLLEQSGTRETGRLRRARCYRVPNRRV